MSHPAISRCVCLLLLAVSVSNPIYAQDSLELEVSLSTLTSNTRSNAPVTLNVRLESWSHELLEGYLELTCYDGERLLSRYRSSELVLTAGERVSRTILPPMALRKDLSQLNVVARFVSGSTSHDLGTFAIRVPVHWRRSFVIGVVHPDETAFAEIGRDLGDALRIDRLDRGDLREIGAASLSSIILPDDVRTDVLGLFSFDVLAITGQGFGELRPDQLDAVAQWGEAGGSIVVVVDRTPSPSQAEFLTRISGIAQGQHLEPGSTTFPVSTQPEKAALEFRLHRPGLGRAVILSAVPDSDASTDFRDAIAFLWKIRSDRVERFREAGTLDVPENPMAQNLAWRAGNQYLEHRPFRPVRLKEVDWLTTILLPDNVQGIPLGIILTILFLFLIAIVPADYLVLGYLKRRRYTWMLLPILSLGFTGFTVWLGNTYLGSTDYRTSLEFIDLTAENRVVRSSRFELLFCATQREVSTDLKQVVHTHVPARREPDEDEWDTPAGMMTLDGEPATDATDAQQDESAIPVYDGNMPASFTVRKQMRQWSPQLSRQTALQTATEIPPYDMDAVDAMLGVAPECLRNPDVQTQLVETIRSVAPDAQLLLFNGGEFFDLTKEETPAGATRSAPPIKTKMSQLLQLIRAACVRPSVGLFSVISQISPNGGADFEDLTILDPSDPTQWLLVVVNAEGDNYVVFRRLFQGDSNGVR